MKRSIFLVIPLSFFLLILISGCPSSGGGGDDDITLDDLVGSYILQGFEIEYSNGMTIDDTDVISFSGTMQVSPNGDAVQNVEINGTQIVVVATILSVSNNYCRVFSDGCTYDLGINKSGRDLITIFPMGACGSDYSETDYWRKVPAASVSSLDSNRLIVLDNEKLQATMGNAFGKIYEYLP